MPTKNPTEHVVTNASDLILCCKYKLDTNKSNGFEMVHTLNPNATP